MPGRIPGAAPASPGGVAPAAARLPFPPSSRRNFESWDCARAGGFGIDSPSLPQHWCGRPTEDVNAKLPWAENRLGVNAQSLLVQQPLCVHFSHYVTKPILGCLFV